ncbi:MAG: VWA domain-containing protein [Roseiflexaceae bacterium]
MSTTIDQPLTLTAQSDRQQIASEVASQRMIEWEIRAQAQPSKARAPLNLALILDRSGSMSGDKLNYVKQAAKHVLDLLEAQDRVAIIAYDDRVTTISSSVLVTAAARQQLKTQIDTLQTGGATDLSGGWLEGCREVASYQQSSMINRALLLTDGLANRGITDLEELSQHASQLRLRGITTSTFGVGLDFNEHLLEAIATQGGGHFYFIEKPTQIPQVFQQELGELLTVVAREVLLSLSIPSGVSLEVLGDLPHERDGERMRIYHGEICAGQQITIYTRALTPPDQVGATLRIHGRLEYADLAGRAQQVQAGVQWLYTREADVRLLPVNEPVLQRSSEVELATAANRALKLERAGRAREAQAIMNQTLAATAASAPPAAAAAYRNLTEQLKDGLSEQQRKQTQFESYKRRHSRKE